MKFIRYVLQIVAAAMRSVASASKWIWSKGKLVFVRSPAPPDYHSSQYAMDPIDDAIVVGSIAAANFVDAGVGHAANAVKTVAGIGLALAQFPLDIAAAAAGRGGQQQPAATDTTVEDEKREKRDALRRATLTKLMREESRSKLDDWRSRGFAGSPQLDEDEPGVEAEVESAHRM
jgi:hypothetical protein